MKTEEYKGNLFFGRNVEIDGKTGFYLVCCPIFIDGTPEWENWGLPEPERLEEDDAREIRKIAERLGCELY